MASIAHGGADLRKLAERPRHHRAARAVAGLKQPLGDILGHRTAESTSMYLRLATGDLRGVSLAVPRSDNAGKGARP